MLTPSSYKEEQFHFEHRELILDADDDQHDTYSNLAPLKVLPIEMTADQDVAVEEPLRKVSKDKHDNKRKRSNLKIKK